MKVRKENIIVVRKAKKRFWILDMGDVKDVTLTNPSGCDDNGVVSKQRCGQNDRSMGFGGLIVF